jgi:flagellar FliL protein
MADQALDEIIAQTPRPAKRGGKKLILFGLLALLLLIGIGAGLYFSGIAQSLLGGGQSSAAKSGTPAQDVVFFDLPDMLVNLNTSGRHANYLKLTLSLQIEHKEDEPKIEAVMPRIIDTCQTYLRELRLEDLKGSAGLYRLREELQMRIGDAVAPVKIDDVLFKQLLVQ